MCASRARDDALAQNTTTYPKAAVHMSTCIGRPSHFLATPRAVVVFHREEDIDIILRRYVERQVKLPSRGEGRALTPGGAHRRRGAW